MVISLLGATLLTGCRPTVTGVILPDAAERNGLPWQRVELKLVHGHVMEQLTRLATKYRDEVVSQARQRVLQALQTERAARAAAAQKARADLPGIANDPSTTSVRTCLPKAEQQLAEARHNYQELLAKLTPRLEALGAPTDSPTESLEYLRQALHTKVDAEATRLRDDYLRAEIVQHSGTVLAGGTGMDRLCWSADNKRDAAVQFRGAVVLYNGKVLPDTLAEQIWRLPAKDRPLRIPGTQGAALDVLQPGAQFEACFFAIGALLPQETVQAYGMSNPPSRSGEWRVQWKDILFVDAAGNVGNAPLPKVFADRLRPWIAQSEESQLIETLTNSEQTRSVSRSETELLACHRAIEQEIAQREVEQAVTAIEAGRDGDTAGDIRMRPVLLELARDPARVTKWNIEALGVINTNTQATLEKSVGAKYTFKDVEPGEYTLLAKPTLDTKKPKLWMINLDVQTGVTRDLVMADARDSSLRTATENILLQQLRKPAPPAKAN